MFTLAVVGSQAFGQTPTPAQPSTEWNYLPLLNAIIDALLPIVVAIAAVAISKMVKNQQMASLLANAVQNSLGAVQQEVSKTVGAGGRLSMNVGSAAIVAGADYVSQHAGEAMKFFKLNDDVIQQKIIAKLGLAAIATNLAETASSAPVVAGPLAPVPLAEKAPAG
jgi:hypothetical protein